MSKEYQQEHTQQQLQQYMAPIMGQPMMGQSYMGQPIMSQQPMMMVGDASGTPYMVQQQQQQEQQPQQTDISEATTNASMGKSTSPKGGSKSSVRGESRQERKPEATDGKHHHGHYEMEKHFGISSFFVSLLTGCLCAPCIYMCCPCDARTVYVAHGGERQDKFGWKLGCGGCGFCGCC